MKKYFPKADEKDRKIVEMTNVFGGLVSPSYLGLTDADAIVVAGDEIIMAFFVDEEEAHRVAMKLKEMGFSTEKKEGTDFFVYDGGNKIFFRPTHLLSDPVNSKEWKLKVSYRALSHLEKLGDLYYSFETGEIIIDGVADENIVSGVFFMYNNNKNHYIVANKMFNYTIIGAIEVIPRTP